MSNPGETRLPRQRSTWCPVLEVPGAAVVGVRVQGFSDARYPTSYQAVESGCSHDSGARLIANLYRVTDFHRLLLAGLTRRFCVSNIPNQNQCSHRIAPR